MNPAILHSPCGASVFFFSFPEQAVVPYSIAQLLGSVLGVLAARVVWGQVGRGSRRLLYAVLQPGTAVVDLRNYSQPRPCRWRVIVLIVGHVSSRRTAWRRFVPWVVGNPDRNGHRSPRHVLPVAA